MQWISYERVQWPSSFVKLLHDCLCIGIRVFQLIISELKASVGVLSILHYYSFINLCRQIYHGFSRLSRRTHTNHISGL